MNLPNTLPKDEVRNVGIVTALLLIAPLPILGSSYYEGVLAHLVIVAGFAVALNIVFGQTDQLFLFMGGLAGLGAYGTALLTNWFGITAWLTLLVSALFAGLVGLVVSWISARRNFTVVLISILTLNLQLVFSEVFVGARDITGGSTGFTYDYFSLEAIGGVVGIGGELLIYYIALVVLLVLLLLYVWLVNSRYGVAFAAIREDEMAAASIGVDVVRYKVIAGFVAAFAFGLVGAFYAREASYILPSAFGFLTVDVLILIVLIVGGLRTTLGPVVGAAIVVAIEEVLVSTITEWRSAIFGIFLIFLFLYFRNGVVPYVGDRLDDIDVLRSGGGEQAGDGSA
jgi:branched-chain amino acid transport system permease protein